MQVVTTTNFNKFAVDLPWFWPWRGFLRMSVAAFLWALSVKDGSQGFPQPNPIMVAYETDCRQGAGAAYN